MGTQVIGAHGEHESRFRAIAQTDQHSSRTKWNVAEQLAHLRVVPTGRGGWLRQRAQRAQQCFHHADSRAGSTTSR